MIVFLDTCVLLDYLENRDRNVVHLVQNIIDNKKCKIATSIFNIIETLDKIQEIRHMAKLVVNNKYSFDEISRDRHIKELSETERQEILNELNNFQEKSKIIIYKLDKQEGYDKVIQLLSKINLKSQDSLILGSYATSEANMFLTKDSDIVKNTKKELEGIFHAKNDLKQIEKIIKKLK